VATARGGVAIAPVFTRGPALLAVGGDEDVLGGTSGVAFEFSIRAFSPRPSE